MRVRDEAAAEMRVLTSFCRDLAEDQRRGITRLKSLLQEVFPALEAALDFRKNRALLVLIKVATPSAARRLGAARLARWLRDRGVRRAEELAATVVEAAKDSRKL